MMVPTVGPTWWLHASEAMTINTPPTLADGHVLGNFHAYYSFNPAHERLRFMDAPTTSALRQTLLAIEGSTVNANGEPVDREPATIMDVGCNEGDLTLGLFKHLIGKRSEAHGGEVDVVTFDDSSVSLLNERAQKNKEKIEYIFTEESGSEHRHHFVCDLQIDGVSVARGEGVSKKVAKSKAASAALQVLQSPGTSDDTSAVIASNEIQSEDILMTKRKRLCVLGVDVDDELIARACKKAFAEKDAIHSDMVEFLHANVMDRGFSSSVDSFLSRARRQPQLESHESGLPRRRAFDLITLFSVTMWIHLNHGDDGLWKFLDSVTELAEHLIVEPQPWKCYRNAIKRLRRQKIDVPASFGSLKVREDVLEKMDAFLLDAGRFRFKAELGKTNWSRPMRLYSRRPINGITYIDDEAKK